MKAFTYERANSLIDAAAASTKPGAKLIAGGTNLLDLMKLQVERPSRLGSGRRGSADVRLHRAETGRDRNGSGFRLHRPLRQARGAAE
jgi:CO/xanthine dehydrogenase FAD-binding subunit